jgi:DNA-binding transcriptional LysR family regulator
MPSRELDTPEADAKPVDTQEDARQARTLHTSAAASVADMAAAGVVIATGAARLSCLGVPEPMVRDDLLTGRLKRLDLSEWSGGFYLFHAIYRTDTPPRPAAAWIIGHFSQQAACS